MSIGARLGLSYSLLIAALVAAGWTGLDRMRRANAQMEDIVNDHWSESQLVRSAVERVNANGRLTLQCFMTSDRRDVERIQAEIKGNKKEITRLIAAIERGLVARRGKALLRRVKEARVRYVASFARAEDLLAAGRRQEAVRVASREMIPRLVEFNKAWDAFVSLEGEKMGAALQDGAAAYAATRAMMIVMLLLACAGAILVAVLVTRGIAAPLKALEKAMKAIMDNGDLSRRVAVSASDEVGVLAATFNRMVANLAEKERYAVDEQKAAERRKALRQATSLSNSKEDDVTTIAQGILQSVCEALAWRQAAYWVLDESVEGLRCAGFWSRKTDRSGEFEAISRKTIFKPGIGLPGRVWENRAPAWIEDVTEDANFPRASFAKMDGLHAAFGFPVLLGDKFHGVLEFFSDKIERPDEELLQTVKTAGQQLGLFLEHKKTQEALKKVRLYQSEKLAAIGQLAAGVAHEINNPLGVILGFAQGMSHQIKPGDALELPIKSIEREAMRCRGLVQNLLTFARASRSDREAMDLNKTVEQALPLVRVQAKLAQVQIRAELAAGLPLILGNKNQIEQVILNLSKNAMDAMPNGGTLTVRSELAESSPHSWVCLKVEDSGTGIAPAVMARIFEPFFTTKPVGQGTGLGLSLINEIARKHSGDVAVESVPGKTVFTVKFPVKTGQEMDERLREAHRAKLAEPAVVPYHKR